LNKDRFFLDGDGASREYLDVRDLRLAEYSKSYCEHLWTRYRPFADRYFLEDARFHFHQRFWEMYLAVTLLEWGIDLKKHSDEGPDFYYAAGRARVWIEAMALSGGEGEDRVPEPQMGKFTRVPHEKIFLRYQSGYSDKRRQYLSALEKGIVSPTDTCIIALNVRRVPHAAFGDTLPFAARAFYPIGPLTVSVPRDDRDVSESFYALRGSIHKLNGSEVGTKTFLDDPTSQFCSGVIESVVDCANFTELFGQDFKFIHNRMARVPLNDNVTSHVHQYEYSDDDRIVHAEPLIRSPRDEHYVDVIQRMRKEKGSDANIG